MGKTLLIVGAGFGQVPAIQKASQMGFNVVTVDKNPKAPGMKIAEFSYDIDVIDKEAILQVAKKHQIDGIMTLQSDFGVPAVGYVNDNMGLKGISYETAIICSNKINCRLKLAENNCNQPDFFIVENVREAIHAFEQLESPCIMKTPDSSASRGIVKVTYSEDIPHAFTKASNESKQSKVILEKFIVGLEFGAQTFSINGNCQMVLMHNDTLSKPPKMIPIGHSFPFYNQHGTFFKQTLLDIKSAVNALEIYDGPANIDLILDEKTKQVKILEIGARIGATCLPELVKYHTGIDWIAESIKSALDIKPDLGKTKNRPVAAMIIQSPRDGIFKNYSINCNPDDYNVIEYEITANEGDKVRRLKNGTDRIGKVVTYGKDPTDAERNAMEFLNNLVIEVA